MRNYILLLILLMYGTAIQAESRPPNAHTPQNTPTYNAEKRQRSQRNAPNTRNDSHARLASELTNHQLYYTTPAKRWEETLPLGNGRLGMMPDGGVEKERIVLNEISLWSGMEADYDNPEASRSLPEIRNLLFEGKNAKAQQLMYKTFVPSKPGEGSTYGNFQLMGFLDINYSYADRLKRRQNRATDAQTNVGNESLPQHYLRHLNLRDAVAYTEFEKSGVTYRREYFIPRGEDVMLIHLTASRKGALTLEATLARPERSSLIVEDNRLILTGTMESGKNGIEGMHYRIAMRMLAKNGKLQTSADRGITLSGGDDAWLILSATTSFDAPGTAFAGKRYVEVCDSLLRAAPLNKASHIASHRSLYDRVTIALPPSPDDALPTNERITRFAQQESPGLAALYYNYGRYLLISSTRPGSLPPNLQGLWANTVRTPWNGDYHTNINVQMNHWPLEQGALSEQYEPLITLVERALPSGERTARSFYGDSAQGWVLHMKTNVWNFTAPGEHPSWGATNTGGAWLCAHLWEHYLYNRNAEYLKHIYPIVKGSADFFYSTLAQEPTHGWLVTAPTSSPENAFWVSKDKVSVCMGPTMDVQLLTELYQNVIEAATLLQCDSPYVAKLKEALTKFPPMQISQEGYLQEWLEDYNEVDVRHRHVSHLYGLHPGNLITPARTPQLAQACRATLNRRGDEGSGWSRAWKVNFWARLGDGDRAWTLFRSLLQPAINDSIGTVGSGTFPNLFCSHSPFQIDGNFGGTAGIGEMLLQSHEGYIHLLPALPKSWHTGSFQGMRVRGNAAVSAQWEEGKTVQATLTATTPGTFIVKKPAGMQQVEITIKGKTRRVTDQMIEVTLLRNETAIIRECTEYRP